MWPYEENKIINRQMEGRTDERKQYIPSLFQSGVIKNHYSKYGKKENLTNTVKNKHEKTGSQSHDTIHHYKPAYEI